LTFRPNRAAVISFPGRQPSAQGRARFLVRHGYGVLLVDPRGQGRSEGDIDRWAGEEDLIAAAEYLQQRPGVDPGKIAGIGFSIGGEQLIEAAAKSHAFAAIVSEGAGGVVGGDDELSGTEKLLAKPTLTVMTGAMMLFQNEHQPPPIEKSIARIAPRPVFLIHADPGMGGELQLQPRFYAAAGEPKQIWKVPGAGHTGGLDAQPAQYEQRVTTFLDQALLER